MRFEPQPVGLQLAVLSNLLPGLLAQLGQARPVQGGMGWVESLHGGRCAEVDRGLHGLGFQSIGPLSCTGWPGWVLRGYTHPGEDTWCVHYLGLFWGSELDFVTEFADGVWLTTTTNSLPMAHKPHQVVRVAHGELGEIWEGHKGAARDRSAERMITGGQRELADALRRFFNWSP